MENQNISYRRLRDLKRGKVGTTSASLLQKRKCRHQPEVTNDKKKDFSIMTQNVTRYEHMLKQPHIKENYIDWIVRLREPIAIEFNRTQEGLVSAPSAYNKNTQSRQNFLKKNQITSARTFNSADFYEILNRKQSHPHLQYNTLKYMTSLRSESFDGIQQSKQKPRFCNIPFKEKNQYPTFLRKEALKKVKNISKSQKESALDGSQNFPPYTHKIIREKNYGLLCTFAEGKNKTSLPTLAWEMGLRN